MHSGSDVYAGGNFFMVGGELQNNLVKINSREGTQYRGIPTLTMPVYAIQTTGTTVIVGGLFKCQALAKIEL